jgi:hypothetical protein
VRITALVMAWIVAVLAADRVATPQQQLLLGAGTWVLLAVLLMRQTKLVRIQTLVVVAFATIIEYTFSSGLHVYDYRLDHVPAYVPPGHGLVYLAAATFGASVWVQRRANILLPLTVAVAAVVAIHGLFVPGRADVLGAFWFLCLVGFILWGRAKTLYIGAYIVVTWLEVLGTHWRVWTWAPVDPVLHQIGIGNPPSVAAGGYGWFDLAAVALAPLLIVGWTRLRGLTERPAAQPELLHSTAPDALEAPAVA